MKIERKIDELGRTTDAIRLEAEEEKALDLAHSIVAERSNAAGIVFDTADKEYHEWMFLGILRFEGVEALLTFARTAEIGRPKRQRIRGYC